MAPISVSLTHDMSAFQAVRVGDHGRYGFSFEGRSDAGDETTSGHLHLLKTYGAHFGSGHLRSVARVPCSLDRNE